MTRCGAAAAARLDAAYVFGGVHDEEGDAVYDPEMMVECIDGAGEPRPLRTLLEVSKGARPAREGQERQDLGTTAAPAQ